MKKLQAALVAASLFLSSGPGAEAKGCLKGAAIGAVAGHLVHHHAVIGAVAGCILGRHIAAKADRERKIRHARESHAHLKPSGR
jgi:hypothetical protein